MENPLLSPHVQQFITGNSGADAHQLALSRNPFPDIDFKRILEQIVSRDKARLKLPSWFAAQDILYPSRISIEQTSSETTAQYKSGLVSGRSLIDLTGGFGVDAFYFAQRVEKVVHCELDAALSGIACHNFRQLGAPNIECEHGEGAQVLQRPGRKWDWIYIDPSRRSEVKGKVFLLKDCLPNVPSLLDLYFSCSQNILVKAAPLLDISAALAELRQVAEIHVVAVDNEVKELLFVLRKGFAGVPMVVTVNLSQQGEQRFVFERSEKGELCEIGPPENYLYEPNAALLKSGAFDEVGIRFGLRKLHRHSHLYTSSTPVGDFPGRKFRIDSVLPYDRASMKQQLFKKAANVSTRNFRESVDEIRKKWQIRSGGERYAFFTTLEPNDKIVLLCAKI